MKVNDAARCIHIFVVYCFILCLSCFGAVRRRFGQPFLPLQFMPPLGFLPIFLSSDPLSVYAVKCIRKTYTQVAFNVIDPLTPRTCHHFTPPIKRFATSSPPKALIKYEAASSHLDSGTRVLTTCVHGGDGVRVFENARRSNMRNSLILGTWVIRALKFFNGMAWSIVIGGRQSVYGLALTTLKDLRRPLKKFKFKQVDLALERITYFYDCESFMVKNVILFQAATFLSVKLEMVKIMLDQNLKHRWPNLKSSISGQ